MNLHHKRQFKDIIIYLESQLIPAIFENIKNKIAVVPFICLNACVEVSMFSDEGDKESQELYEYYIQIIENYIIDCKNKLIEEEKSNLIDGFLFHTKNINFVIYCMYRVFSYLDKFYTIVKLIIT